MFNQFARYEDAFRDWRRDGKVWRFDAAELDDWIKSGGLEPDPIKKPHGPFRDRVYPPDKPSGVLEDAETGPEDA